MKFAIRCAAGNPKVWDIFNLPDGDGIAQGKYSTDEGPSAI